MKIKLELDFSEFDIWTDEDGETNLGSEIRLAIISQVKNEVVNKYLTSAIREMSETVRHIVEQEYEQNIRAKILEIVTEMIDSDQMVQVYGNTEISIKKHISQLITNNNSRRWTEDAIDKICSKHFKEQEERYDLAFSTGLIKKLSEGNYLNANAYKLLGLEPQK
jgi:predicted XRE-type DNA-binding protein